MNIIDTHSHIYEEVFKDDITDIIERAEKAGIIKILLPNVDTSTIGDVNFLSDLYPGYCIPMMGLHPTSVNENWQSELSVIKAEFTKRNYIAVGEIGIDLHWDKTFEKEQKLAFKEQLQWSIEYNLPVSIHSRNAIGECIDCIRNTGAEKLRGVFHSFGGNESELDEILSLKNFFLGINGSVTYKNSTLPAVLQNTGLSHVIIETDSPYLPPMPYRGKRNESSYIIKVLEKISGIYNTDIEETAKITYDNSRKLFGL